MQRSIALLLLLCVVNPISLAQGNVFKRLRYQGGTVQTQTKPDEWGNTLTVTSDEIILKLKDGQSFTLKPQQVTGLSYGQEAHRRVGTMVALSALMLNPIPLFGLMHKKRDHFIGVEFTTEGGKKGSWLLQADKDNYRAVIVTLRGVMGADVAVAPEDRKYIPVRVEDVDPKKIEEKKKH
jgi:hypothetical protein